MIHAWVLPPSATNELVCLAMDDTARQLARDLLDWYRATGVTDAVAPDAIDWLSRGPKAPGADFWAATALQRAPAGTAPSRAPPAAGRLPASSVAPQPPSPRPASPAPRPPTAAAVEAPRQFATPPPDEAVISARAAAGKAADLAALTATLRDFNGCALKASAKNLCFYRGAEKSRLMLIGEAPGRDEDLDGRPFVGPAGRLLDRMLAAIGIGEADAQITNIVYWRPPGNRTPTPVEAQVCRPFLERQVQLVEPELVVLLGGAAAKHLLGVDDGIMRLRGKWREIEIGGRRVRALATLHPAFLLRTPAQKRLAWRDMLALAAALDG